MSLTSMLESKGDLKRPTITKDSKGGTIQTFETVSTDHSCSVQPADSDVTIHYAQKNVQVNISIYFATNISPQVSDIFEVTDNDGVLHKYLVQGDSKDLLNRIKGPYRMDCLEIK